MPEYCVEVFFPGKSEPGIHEHLPCNDEGLDEVSRMERRYQGQGTVFVSAYGCQEEEK